mmetsp:Transcript_23282/g.20652  ORF Transcript_23282/g.20652 Transcript_23282/m.20652 type:complete len:213 (-) Transcript_23282:398-1036(-)
MDIILGDVDEVNPTIDYDILMSKRRGKNQHTYTKSLNTTHRNSKLKTLGKNSYLKKINPLPQIKLQRKKCLNFDSLSSDDSMNEVLNEFKIDRSENVKFGDSNKALLSLIRTTMSNTNGFKINNSLQKTFKINKLENNSEDDDTKVQKSRNSDRFTKSRKKAGRKSNKSHESMFRISKIRPVKKIASMIPRFKGNKKKTLIYNSIKLVNKSN